MAIEHAWTPLAQPCPLLASAAHLHYVWLCSLGSCLRHLLPAALFASENCLVITFLHFLLKVAPAHLVVLRVQTQAFGSLRTFQVSRAGAYKLWMETLGKFCSNVFSRHCAWTPVALDKLAPLGMLAFLLKPEPKTATLSVWKPATWSFGERAPFPWLKLWVEQFCSSGLAVGFLPHLTGPRYFW